MATLPPTANDRVRSELSFNVETRHRQVGRVVHEALAYLASLDRAVDLDEVDGACETVLAAKPINAPRQLARPMTQITSATAMGVRLLPRLAWQFIAAEIELPSGTIVDQEFRCAEPAIVEDHIGDVLGVEIKLAAAIDTARLPDTRAQVRGHIDGLVAVHGDRVLGVATYCIGHAARSVLTLADHGRTEVPLSSTDLCDFPRGRLR